VRHEIERPASRRLPSIDVARGLTIAGMIVVNTAGGLPVTHPWLQHARWDGWTIADLGMPVFLFLVGAAAHFVVATRRERGESRRVIARHALVRSLALFALGIVATGFPHYALATMPVSGVLQRIAVIYVAIMMFEMTKGSTAEVAAIVVILAVFAVLTSSSLPAGPVAGVRASDLRDFYTLLPALASGLLGAMAGRWLRRRGLSAARGLAAAGVLLMIGGMTWSHWLPINKQLWTSSYTILTAGVAALGLSGISALIDRRLGLGRSATLLLALGRNSLIIYAGSTAVDELAERYISIGIDGRTLPLKLASYRELTDIGLSAPQASTTYALVYLLPWLALAWWLHRRHILIRL
jgi:predicted acyltransferase